MNMIARFFENLMEKMRGYKIIKDEEKLSPACRQLLDTYFLYHYEGEVYAIGVYPELRSVVIFFQADIFQNHPSYSKDNLAHIVKVTFLDVPDAAVSYSGQAICRNEIVKLPPNGEKCLEHSIEEFELKGNSLYESSTQKFHNHLLAFEADNLLVMFPFKDLVYEEVDPRVLTAS